MPLIDIMTQRLRRHPKRIVFPEGADPRILQAARQFVARGLGVPILLGVRQRIKANAAELNINLEGIRVLEPSRSEEIERFIPFLEKNEAFSRMDRDALVKVASGARMFATLMLRHGNASGLVSGATVARSSALKPILQLIPKQSSAGLVSGLQMLDFEEPVTDSGGVLFLADTAVNTNPTPVQLAEIATTTGALAFHLTDQVPRIAMLSYASHSQDHPDPGVEKMRNATEMARKRAESLPVKMEIDGELQVDVALSQASAASKHIGGAVAGQANVLVFPDLDAADIASRLAGILTGARTYGSLMTGLQLPVAEISRSASAHDILGTAVMVGAQAIDHRFLYAEGQPVPER